MKFRPGTVAIFLLGAAWVVAVFLFWFAGDSTKNPNFELDRYIKDYYFTLKRIESYEECSKIADQIQLIGLKRRDDLIRARGLSREAFAEIRYGKWGEGWEQLLEKADDLCGPNDSLARAELHLFRGFIKGNWQSKFDEGINEIREAIRIGLLLDADHLLVFANCYLAQLLIYKNEPELALESALTAYVIAKCYDSKELRYEAIYWAIHSASNLDRPELYVGLAKEMTKIDPSSLRAHRMLHAAGQPNRLEELVSPEIAQYESTALPVSKIEYQRMGNLYLAMAEIRRTQENLSEALEFLDKAISSFANAGSQTDVVASEFDRAYVKLLQGSHSEAIKELERLQSKCNGELSNLVSRKRIIEFFTAVDDQQNVLRFTGEIVDHQEKKIVSKMEDIIGRVNESWKLESSNREHQKRIQEQQFQANARSQMSTVFLAICAVVAAIAATRFWALKQNGVALERLVAQRTESLRVAMEDAELASRSKSEFLARANHEIRNPLHLISGYAELLIELGGFKDMETREYVSAIGHSCEHLDRLLENVMQICEIGEGAKVPVRRKFQLENIRLAIEGMFKESARSKNLALMVDVHAPAARELWGDDTILLQILINLVSNAIKYTDEGEVHVELSVTSETESKNPAVQCAVRDTGLGIDESYHDRLFDPFAKLPNSERGKGLGLHITKTLVELVEGNIRFESEPGVGTVFWLDFPVYKSAPVEELSAVYDAESFENLRFVVVDDKANIGALVVKQFEQLGHQVAGCDSMESTLRTVVEFEPHVVLVDLRMPAHDGFDVMQAIRAQDSQVLIVAMTGDVTTETWQRTIDAGFDGFLEKPFRKERLSRLIEELQIKKATRNWGVIEEQIS